MQAQSHGSPRPDGLAMTGLGNGLVMTTRDASPQKAVIARSAATRQSMPLGCHCEERSDVAIHAGTKPWIATAWRPRDDGVGGLAMTGLGNGLAMTQWLGLATTARCCGLAEVMPWR